jgi:hypothetical protein
MSSSAEARILEAVIVGDEDEVNAALAECYTFELPQIREQAVRMITMIDREQERRRRGVRTPAADTGEINIIRGRE